MYYAIQCIVYTALHFVITVHTSLDLGITQRALSPASSLTMGALSAVMKFIVIL